MRRWVICMAGLAVCLLACGTPQPQKTTQNLHEQLYALALQKEPKARWHCRVQWEGEQAWGTACSEQSRFYALWRLNDGWDLEYLLNVQTEN